MRRSHAFPILVLTLLAVAPVAAAQDFDADGEQAMLDRINALRAENQLAPLSRLPELDAVARAHSSEMASRSALTHVSPATGTPEDRVRRAGVGASTIAENVAHHRDSLQAHQALLDSPAHRANMLNPSLTHIGLGSVRTAQGVYVTQLFAAVRPPQPAPPAVAAADPEAQPEAQPAAEAAPVFQIIPPFVEQVLGATGVVPEASSATPPVSTASTPAPSTAPAAGAPVSPATAARVRELLGLAQSLLNGGQ